MQGRRTMQTRGEMMRHWRLVNRMAKTTDPDLVSAFKDGRLSSDAWAGMVEACRGCAWSDTCADWLDGHDHVDTAPRPCCNRARFAALRTGSKVEA
ncbi:MAG: hypothetical protein CML65_09940 [Rhodobacteraceae bacterium]|nr:hypothetical protein [Paracoccaceae bacterium]